MDNQAEAYEMLWHQPPSCFSESDIFEKKVIYDDSKSYIPDQGPNNTMRSIRNMGANKVFNSGGQECTPSNSLKRSAEPDIIVKMNENPKLDQQKMPKNQYIINGEKVRLSSTSCFIFTTDSIIRKIAIKIITWKYSQTIINIAIILNAILLGIIDYKYGFFDNKRNAVVILDVYNSVHT